MILKLNKHVWIFLIGLRQLTLIILAIVTVPIWILPVIIYLIGDEYVVTKNDVGGPL